MKFSWFPLGRRVPFGRPEHPLRAELEHSRSKRIYYCKLCGKSSTESPCPFSKRHSVAYTVVEHPVGDTE